MRRWFVVLALMLLAGAGLVALVQRDPGYILVSWGLTTVETSFWVGLVLLLGANLLLLLLWRLLGRLPAVRRAFGNWAGAAARRRELERLARQLDAGEHNQVAAALEERDPAGLAAAELRLLVRARRGMGDWTGLIALLPRLRKQGAMEPGELKALAAQAHTGSLAGKSGEDLLLAWSRLPTDRKKRPALVAAYARALGESGDHQQAERLLRRAIRRQWDAGLIAEYGRLDAPDPASCLKRAEKWLEQHQEDPALLLCLGRLSLRNELWGMARGYFESAHRFGPSAEVCAELARLLAALGEPRESARYWREGLMLAQGRLPDLPLPSPTETI